MKAWVLPLAGLVLTLSGCADQKAQLAYQESQSKLIKTEGLLNECRALVNNQEYILQAPEINFRGPSKATTLGAYHGVLALQECEQEAQALTQKTHMRAWCRQSLTQPASD